MSAAPALNDTIATRTQVAATDWAAATCVGTMIFDFQERALLPDSRTQFCASRCPMVGNGGCDPELAHRFGCYEAERWEDQFVYYCPASLVFVATLIREQGLPSYGLVTGPLVMGPVEDLICDLDQVMSPLVVALPSRSPAEVGSLTRVQLTICSTISTPAPATEPGLADKPGATEAVWSAANEYPLDAEKRLVAMIRRGDRAGATELINQLLASLYLASDGDFVRLRQGAAELITLFSRAAIDGGADVHSIFGEKRVLDRRIANCRTLDEVSGLLVSVFNRFVSYVFDFSQFQHANVLRQTVNYIRSNYAGRVSLADAARAVAMSPNYLSSVFSAAMGVSFTAYVQSVRVAKSKELLAGTRKSIADIAAETGFSDQSYFSKVFTKATGMSPTHYRQKECD
ncbi:MAG: AraC family transcriptional regulator [Acidobacteriota bacterium]|nr:AraC family transcriptional regulator [Acidobacteriota bacterium]